MITLTPKNKQLLSPVKAVSESAPKEPRAILPNRKTLQLSTSTKQPSGSSSNKQQSGMSSHSRSSSSCSLSPGGGGEESSPSREDAPSSKAMSTSSRNQDISYSIGGGRSNDAFSNNVRGSESFNSSRVADNFHTSKDSFGAARSENTFSTRQITTGSESFQSSTRSSDSNSSTRSTDSFSNNRIGVSFPNSAPRSNESFPNSSTRSNESFPNNGRASGESFPESSRHNRVSNFNNQTTDFKASAPKFVTVSGSGDYNNQAVRILSASSSGCVTPPYTPSPTTLSTTANQQTALVSSSSAESLQQSPASYDAVCAKASNYITPPPSNSPVAPTYAPDPLPDMQHPQDMELPDINNSASNNSSNFNSASNNSNFNSMSNNSSNFNSISSSNFNSNSNISTNFNPTSNNGSNFNSTDAMPPSSSDQDIIPRVSCGSEVVSGFGNETRTNASGFSGEIASKGASIAPGFFTQEILIKPMDMKKMSSMPSGTRNDPLVIEDSEIPSSFFNSKTRANTDEGVRINTPSEPELPRIALPALSPISPSPSPIPPTQQTLNRAPPLTFPPSNKGVAMEFSKLTQFQPILPATVASNVSNSTSEMAQRKLCDANKLIPICKTVTNSNMVVHPSNNLVVQQPSPVDPNQTFNMHLTPTKVLNNGYKVQISPNVNINIKPDGGMIPLTQEQLFDHQLKTDQKGANSPDYKTAFRNKLDACKRMIRYHVYAHKSVSVKDQNQNEMAQQINAENLLRKKDSLMYKYQSLLLKDSQRRHPTAETVMLYRLFLNEEKANFEREKNQADGKFPFKNVQINPIQNNHYPWEETWPEEKLYTFPPVDFKAETDFGMEEIEILSQSNKNKSPVVKNLSFDERSEKTKKIQEDLYDRLFAESYKSSQQSSPVVVVEKVEDKKQPAAFNDSDEEHEPALQINEDEGGVESDSEIPEILAACQSPDLSPLNHESSIVYRRPTSCDSALSSSPELTFISTNDSKKDHLTVARGSSASLEARFNVLKTKGEELREDSNPNKRKRKHDSDKHVYNSSESAIIRSQSDGSVFRNSESARRTSDCKKLKLVLKTNRKSSYLVSNSSDDVEEKLKQMQQKMMHEQQEKILEDEQRRKLLGEQNLREEELGRALEDQRRKLVEEQQINAAYILEQQMKEQKQKIIQEQQLKLQEERAFLKEHERKLQEDRQKQFDEEGKIIKQRRMEEDCQREEEERQEMIRQQKMEEEQKLKEKQHAKSSTSGGGGIPKLKMTIKKQNSGFQVVQENNYHYPDPRQTKKYEEDQKQHQNSIPMSSYPQQVNHISPVAGHQLNVAKSSNSSKRQSSGSSKRSQPEQSSTGGTTAKKSKRDRSSKSTTSSSSYSKPKAAPTPVAAVPHPYAPMIGMGAAPSAAEYEWYKSNATLHNIYGHPQMIDPAHLLTQYQNAEAHFHQHPSQATAALRMPTHAAQAAHHRQPPPHAFHPQVFNTNGKFFYS